MDQVLMMKTTAIGVTADLPGTKNMVVAERDMVEVDRSTVEGGTSTVADLHPVAAVATVVAMENANNLAKNMAALEDMVRAATKSNVHNMAEVANMSRADEKSMVAVAAMEVTSARMEEVMNTAVEEIRDITREEMSMVDDVAVMMMITSTVRSAVRNVAVDGDTD